MSSYPPPFPTYPILTPETFNNDFFTNTESGLSLDSAYKYFLRLTGGTISGNLNVLLDFNNSGNTYLNTLYIDNFLVSSTADELNYNSGITLGVGTANKVLSLDPSKNVSGINKVFTKYLDIDNDDTTPFSVSGLSDNYGLHLHSQITGTGQNYGAAISFNHNATGNVVPLSAIVLDKTANGFGDLVFYNRNGTANLQENFRMKSDGEFKCGSLNINNVALTASATELNYLDFSGSYTLGVNEASKAVVLDASRNTSNINQLSTTGLISTIIANNTTNFVDYQTWTNDLATDMNVVLRMSNIGSTFGNISSHPLRLITNGTNRLVIEANGNISITSTQASSNRTTGALTIAGGLGVNGNVYATRFWMPDSQFGLSHAYTTGGTAEIITYNNGTTGSYIGTFTSHNFGLATVGFIRIGVDTSGNVNIVNHNSSTIGLRLNNTLITASGAEINYLDLTTGAGTAEFNKALVLDGTGNITGIVGLTSTNLNCTTLSIGGTAITATASELNALDFTTGGAGTAEGNKALVVNGSRDITNINSLTATSLTGLLQTVNQSNITGLGTLNALNCSGLVDFSNTTQTTNPTSGALKVAGGVGINKALWVNNNVSTNGRLRTLNAGIGLEHTDNTIGLISYVNIADLVLNQGAYFGTNTNHNLIFQTNELERMRINAGGNVSIGNTNNTYKVDITGDCNVSGAFRVGGVALPSTGDLSKISGITNGVVSANKAVVVDGSKDITGFNKITTSELVVSKISPDITTNVNVDGNMIVDGDITLDVGNLNIKRNISGTAGNATIERNFTCNGEFRLKPDGFSLEWGSDVRTLIPPFHYAIGTLNSNGWLLMANDNSDGIWLDSSNKIGIHTKSPSYDLDVDGDFNADTFYLNGTQITSSASELNVLDGFTGTTAQLNYLSGTTLGTITASKVLTVDASSNINSILRLKKVANGQQIYFENGTSTGTVYQDLNGSFYFGSISSNDLIFQTNNTTRLTLTSAGLLNIQGGWQISGTTVSASATELNYVDTTAGTAEASKALILNSSRNITNINEISTTGTLTMGNVNRFIVMRNSGLTNGQNVNFVLGRTSATNEQAEITFTYSTTANASYLSLGHFGSPSMLNIFQSGNVSIGNTSNAYRLDVSGDINLTGSLRVNTTSVDLSAITGVTAGTTSTSKALIVDTNRDIVNIRKIGLTGNDNFLTLSNPNASGRTTIFFDGDTTDWEFGSRNSTNSSYPNNFYIYGNLGFRFVIDPSGNVDIINHNGSTTGLKLGGTLITASATELNYVDVVAGTGTASKALVLDSNRSISNVNVFGVAEIVVSPAMRLVQSGGINYLQSGATATSNSASDFFIGNYLNTTSTSARKFMIKADGKVGIQTDAPSYTLDVSGDINLTGDLRKSGTVCKINALTGVTDGTASANKCLIVDAFKSLQGLGLLSSERHVIEYDNLHGLIVSADFSDTDIKIENTTAGGRSYWLGVSGTGSAISSGSFYIYDETGTKTPLQINTQGKVGINLSSSPTDMLHVNGNGRITGALMVGTSTDSGRLISALDSAQATGTSKYICFGRSDTNGNQAEISFYYAGNDSDSNRIDFGFYGGAKMYLTKNGRLGIGTDSPSTFLHVSGSVSSTVSIGTHGFLNDDGAGWDLNPITFNNSLRTSSSIYCGGTVYSFSDRRIKKDIEELSDDYSDKFFNDVKLIKHRYTHEEETSNKYLGVIAQDVLKSGYMELIAMHPNENMKKETDEDIEGFVMNVDYAKIALLCVQQIKKLKKELRELREVLGINTQSSVGEEFETVDVNGLKLKIKKA